VIAVLAENTVILNNSKHNVVKVLRDFLKVLCFVNTTVRRISHRYVLNHWWLIGAMVSFARCSARLRYIKAVALSTVFTLQNTRSLFKKIPCARYAQVQIVINHFFSQRMRVIDFVVIENEVLYKVPAL